jgi:hypothetical protein
MLLPFALRKAIEWRFIPGEAILVSGDLQLRVVAIPNPGTILAAPTACNFADA